MGEAPERIYLDGDVEAGDGIFPRCFENPKYVSEPPVEYVRAARIEELEAKLAKLARAAKPFAAIKIKDGRSQVGEIGRTDVTNLRAALGELKGEQDD